MKYLNEEKKEVTAHFMNEIDTTKKNLPAVNKVMNLMPAVSELAKHSDTKSIKNYLDNTDRLAFPLLRWIITSNRAYLVKLEKKDVR